MRISITEERQPWRDVDLVFFEVEGVDADYGTPQTWCYTACEDNWEGPDYACEGAVDEELDFAEGRVAWERSVLREGLGLGLEDVGPPELDGLLGLSGKWFVWKMTYFFVRLTCCCDGENSFFSVAWDSQAACTCVFRQVEGTRHVFGSFIFGYWKYKIGWLRGVFCRKECCRESCIESPRVDVVDQIAQVEDEFLIFFEQR